jgi:hypothetical protein
MNNQLYEIQLNQCYRVNPNQLTCKCRRQDLTEKIKNIIENNNKYKIGRMTCNGMKAYCTCDNGTWISILC